MYVKITTRPSNKPTQTLDTYAVIPLVLVTAMDLRHSRSNSVARVSLIVQMNEKRQANQYDGVARPF